MRALPLEFASGNMPCARLLTIRGIHGSGVANSSGPWGHLPVSLGAMLGICALEEVEEHPEKTKVNSYVVLVLSVTSFVWFSLPDFTL